MRLRITNVAIWTPPFPAVYNYLRGASSTNAKIALSLGSSQLLERYEIIRRSGEQYGAAIADAAG
jgi:hypothetical protein